MKHTRFELSSEQTLRLEALRNTLAEALPAEVGEKVEFPVARYGCPCGCTVYYYVTCATLCYNGCLGTCKGTCMSFCGSIVA